MFKGTIIQYFHWYLPADGNLWKQLKEDAPKLKAMGFSAVWLPPAYKSMKGPDGVGYAPYDLFDLGEFDQKGSVRTKYGTRQEYIDVVKAVRDNNMQAMVDIVLNHKAGGDEIEKIKVVKVDPNNRNKVISEPFEIEAFTKFTFPGRNKKYSEFIWDFMCFTGVDCAADAEQKGIFRIISGYGDDWQQMIDDEMGDYDYLMFDDINFRNEYVRNEVSQWAKWFYDQAPFDGVRLDAVKHIPAWFYNEWISRLRQDTGQEIFAVAEYWSPGRTDVLLKYIETTNGSMSVFDATLQQNFHQASQQGKDYDLSKIFENTMVAAAPAKTVTLVGNHDTQPLQALEAPVEHWFKPIAYALILLRDEGYPCVFHPDLYGAHYKDFSHDGNEYEIWIEKVEHIDKLLQARCDYAFGTQRNYLDHPNCIGWTREGDEHHSGCAILISNGDNGNKYMEIGKRYAGRTFYDLLQKNDAEVPINEDGWGEFFAPAGSLSVWIEKL
ncbi:MAG: alpha-amylase [Ginsengibacter sp.]